MFNKNNLKQETTSNGVKSSQKLLLGFVVMVFFLSFSPEIAYSAIDPLKELRGTIRNIYDILFTAGTLLALAILVYGGVILGFSGGIPQQITKAKEWISSALIGLLILLSSAAILLFFGIIEEPWLLEKIEIEILPKEIPPAMIRYSHCQGINLTVFTNELEIFLNEKQEEKNTIARKSAYIQNRSENFVSDAKRFCNAFFGTWTKCVEYKRRATFVGVATERPQIAHYIFPHIRLLHMIIGRDGEIRDGCAPKIREEADLFAEKIIRERYYIENNLERTIDGLSKSEQVKKLEAVLRKLSHCQLDLRTILYTHQQADELGLIQALNLGDYEFFCCTR